MKGASPFILYFLIQLGAKSSEVPYSIVKTFGKVSTEVPSTRGTKIGAEACVKTCSNDIECILSFMDADGYCLNYKYAQFNSTIKVVQTTIADGLTVAFKTNAITCPVKYSSITGLAYSDQRNSANYPFQWTRDGTSWTLENPCPWLIFKRSDTVTVCIMVFAVNNVNYTEAKNFCTEKGYRLTGLVDQREVDAVSEAISGKCWVDGITYCSSQCTASQYTFTDGYTVTTELNPKIKKQKGFSCLHVVNRDVWDQNCDDRDLAAVACGFYINGNTF